MRLLALAAVVWMSALGPVMAGPAAEATRRGLEGAEPKERVAGSLAATDTAEARFGEGLLRVAGAIERWGQSQYRYGLRPPRGVPMPLTRLPVPPNPSPEPIDYAAQRAALTAFLADLKSAEAALARVDGDVKIVLDLNAIYLDVTKSGKVDEAGRLGALLRGMMMTGDGAPQGAAPFEVAFDRGDALWLQGYCNLLAAFAEFALAHDWRETFDVAAPLFYARFAGDPARLESPMARQRQMFGDGASIADALATLHTIRWPVIEPARLLASRAHLLRVFQLSRESWKAILAETDDDREWLPSPRQTGAARFAPVGQEQIEGWMAVIDEFEAALTGRKLVPHWRWEQGFNLARVFAEPRPFDPVLWATGHAVLPYLENGPTLSNDDWARWRQMFRGNFFGYALWFN